MNGTTRSCGAAVLLLAIHLAAGRPAAAQTPERANASLPPELAAELLDFYNGEQAVRMTGPTRIAPGSEVVGDVAVLEGPLTIAGRIRGRLVVINGDVRFEPGAELAGDLIVVGGVVTGLDAVMVTGTVLRYREPLRYDIDADGRLVAVVPVEEPGLSAGREFPFGRTDLTLAARRGYNRVEGLPVAAGARVETRSANPTGVSALLIYRTESGLSPDADELGYVLRAEQFLGGRRALRLGATLHSEIVPIEAWGLSDRENSLATFLLHRDYRDHYEREGWSAYLRLAPPDRPHELVVEFRNERHRAVRTSEPWALFGDDDWRPQPRVAEGTLRSLAVRLGYDTRNAGGHPTSGWYIQAEVERGVDGSLTLPRDDDCPINAQCLPATRAVDPGFAAGFVDLRRYARVGPDSRLAVRARVAGSLNDRPLPPQRQHALGGEGSLPGYRLYRFDCGARAAVHAPFTAAGFFPYYGCDRLALVQIEYQSAFPFGRGWGRKLGWDLDLGDTPAWVVFFDAGRAWTERVALDGRTRGEDDFAADAGLGLRLGRIGAYWAFPLSGHDRGINFFVRFGSRL